MVISGLDGDSDVGNAGVDGVAQVPGVVGWGWASSGRDWGGRASGGGMAWRVEDPGHLSVIDAKGVLAKGGVGVFVFKGFGLPFLPVVVVLAVVHRWGGQLEHVVIQVPGRWQELIPGGSKAELVVTTHLIGGSQNGSCSLPLDVMALFMLLWGCWRWYSFSRCRACKWLKA